MTYEQLKQQKELILLDCISGSTAYNLNVAGQVSKYLRTFLCETTIFTL